MSGGLFDIFSSDSNNKTTNAGYDTGITDIRRGAKKAKTDIANLNAQAAPQYQASANAFQPFMQTGTGANKILADITGVNGTDAQAAAQKLIETNPGYLYTQHEGEQGVLRNAAAMGRTNSGQDLQDLSGYDQNLAYNLNYAPWIAQLQGLSGQGIQGAQGYATGLTNLGNMFQTQGENYGNIDTGAAANLANLSVGKANQQVANNNASSVNSWNAVLNGANMGAKALGFYA